MFSFVYGRKSYLDIQERYQNTTFDENEFDSHFGLRKSCEHCVSVPKIVVNRLEFSFCLEDGLAGPHPTLRAVSALWGTHEWLLLDGKDWTAYVDSSHLELIHDILLDRIFWLLNYDEWSWNGYCCGAYCLPLIVVSLLGDPVKSVCAGMGSTLYRHWYGLTGCQHVLVAHDPFRADARAIVPELRTPGRLVLDEDPALHWLVLGEDPAARQARIKVGDSPFNRISPVWTGQSHRGISQDVGAVYGT